MADLTPEHKLLCDVAAVKVHLDKYSRIEQRALLSRVMEHLGTVVEAQRAPAQRTLLEPDIIGVLKSVHSALDDALGDTDISHIESDDELREEVPVQWAAQWLAHAIELLEEQSAITPTESQPVEDAKDSAS